MTKRSIALAVIAALGLGGWLAWNRTETPREGVVENPWAPTPMEVDFHGHTVATITTKEAPVTVRIARGDDTHDALTWSKDALVERVATPCGVKTVQLTTTSVDAGVFRTTTIAATDTSYAFVDNRGGPPRTLRVGELELAVPPDGVLRQAIFVEGCTDDVAVKLDGADLGPTRPKESLLVDPTGRRCYLLREVQYGMPMFLGDPKPPVMLPPKKLRELRYGVSVLEPAPERVQTIGLTSERHELTEVPCEER